MSRKRHPEEHIALSKEEVKKLTTIDEVEEKIQEIECSNARIKRIRNLKLFGLACSKLAPYVIVSGLVGTLCSTINGTPFVTDDNILALTTTATITSEGDYESEEKYELKQNSYPSTIVVYSNWKRENNGDYYRTVDRYTIPEISEEDALKLISNLDANTVNELFHDCKTTNERRTSKPQNTSSYAEITVRKSDNSNTISIPESPLDNLKDTAMFVLLLLISNSILALLREENSYSYSGAKNDIIRKHKLIDDAPLREKIKNLTRKQAKF